MIMARRKAPPVHVPVDADLAERLREVRRRLLGEGGGPELARLLGLPARTWYNYETGVTIPAEVLLRFIEITGADPAFLRTGEGDPLKPEGGKPARARPVADLLREALGRLEASAGQAGDGVAGGPPAGHVAIPLFPFDGLAAGTLGEPEGAVLARRDWVANPSQTVAARVPDEAMHPVIPGGSVVAIDRSQAGPVQLHGRIVAARLNGAPTIRWLEISGGFQVFRPNQPHRDFPMVPVPIDAGGPSPIIGKVVCSWNVYP
jgi:hypothetical protein